MRCERHPRPQVQVGATGRGEVAPGGAPRQRERTPVVGLANLAPAGGESSAAGAAREGGEGEGAPPPNPPRGGHRQGTRSPPPRRNQQGGFHTPDPDPSDSDPGSGSDSDSSLSDSGTEADNEHSRDAEIRKLQCALKALKKKKKSYPQKPSQLDIRLFNSDPDDMQRFVLDIETNFDYHRKALYKDMDKIWLLVPLLEGKAKKWYENIHPNINKHAAARQGIPFDKKSSLRKWDVFFAHLQSSFGQSLTQDKSVLEWNRLRHRNGNIDYFLDRIHSLMYATNYTGEMVIDKIKEGLTDEIQRNWALVKNKPKPVTEYMAALQAFAHKIEQTDNYSRQNRSRSSGEAAEPSPRKEKKGNEKKEKKDKRDRPSQPQSQPIPSKGKGTADLKDRETELRGIPNTIIEECKKAAVCLKCGKPNHKWFKCFTRNPVTRSVAAASKKKRKRDEDKKEEAPAAMKAKVERLTAGPSTEAKRSPSPRIFEVEDSSSDAMDLYD